MRALTILVLGLALSACSGSEPAETKPQSPPPPTSDLALPVAAPLQARDRLLHDIDVQNKEARDRKAKLDQLFEQR